MRRKWRAFVVASGIATWVGATGCGRLTTPSPGETSPGVTAEDLRLRLTAFAHDSMMGREAGTIWNVKATDWVAAQFQRYGLEPAGENGTFFQVVPNIRVRDAAALRGDARNVIAIVRGSDPALRGEYVAITGPSGCGKSTLLSVLGLLDVPNEGEYFFEGQNVAGWSEARLNALRRGRVGFIFQSFNLIEELSVYENVELALEYTV